MTTQTQSLADFLLARIAEDEAVARAAVGTPGAEEWHWVNTETDEHVEPNLTAVDEYHMIDGSEVSLRSVAALRPSTSGPPLPDFAIWSVDDIRASVAAHIVRHDPARALARCKADREIVHIVRDLGGHYEPDAARQAPDILRALASIYADHPDYRPEWRP